MSTHEIELLENINKRLAVIIGLLIRNLPNSDSTLLREQVVMLHELGMRPIDIAVVMGKSTNHINVELSASRNQKKKGKRKK